MQSTDFSHFLPQHDAVRRDQEVLNILGAEQLDAAGWLRQPEHTDSRGVSNIYSCAFNGTRFRAKPMALFNANSQDYADRPVSRSTSYIVQLYEFRSVPRVGPHLPGSKVFCFAGNTFFGRGVLRALGNRGEAERVQRELKYFSMVAI